MLTYLHFRKNGRKSFLKRYDNEYKKTILMGSHDCRMFSYALLRKRTEEYAIVISDYEMPTMNGNELCNKLISLNPKLKVILISAYDNV